MDLILPGLFNNRVGSRFFKITRNGFGLGSGFVKTDPNPDPYPTCLNIKLQKNHLYVCVYKLKT